MNLLFRVIHASRCSSTHHKLAVDALRHLQGSSAERWRNLFLRHIDVYLEGSKAPDKKFRATGCFHLTDQGIRSL